MRVTSRITEASILTITPIAIALAPALVLMSITPRMIKMTPKMMPRMLRNLPTTAFAFLALDMGRKLFLSGFAAILG
jgi:hypothetical protein